MCVCVYVLLYDCKYHKIKIILLVFTHTMVFWGKYYNLDLPMVMYVVCSILIFMYFFKFQTYIYMVSLVYIHIISRFLHINNALLNIYVHENLLCYYLQKLYSFALSIELIIILPILWISPMWQICIFFNLIVAKWCICVILLWISIKHDSLQMI